MAELSSDEAEIIALIHRNRIAIWTQDYESYEQCFVHTAYTTRWGWWKPGGTFVRQGWDEISARVREQFKDPRLYVPENAYDTAVENLTLRIGMDMAWATFDQIYPVKNIEGHTGPGLTREVRFFERHDGKWKIAFLGFLDNDAGRLDARSIRLADDGSVMWKSQAAAEALAEAGDGLPSRVWWVIRDGGMIIFSMGNPGVTAERLQVAAMVFGLSPAQTKLAALIAEGLALTEIAKRLSISPHTARTHLERVYEKTGVRTQPALVRVLLSAVAPL